jgi:hypothetical protein
MCKEKEGESARRKADKRKQEIREKNERGNGGKV